MDEKRKPRKKAGAILAVAVLLLFILPVVYVASIGPATWMVINRHAKIRAYRHIYGPVVALETRGELALNAMDWWRGLFLDDDDEWLWLKVQSGNAVLNDDGSYSGTEEVELEPIDAQIVGCQRSWPPAKQSSEKPD
jgi:hypothetical protein